MPRCPETQPVNQPPPDIRAATFSTLWLTDGTIWAAPGQPYGGRWYAGGPQKVGWWRSTSGTLVITGQRLDGQSSALRANVPSGYGQIGFQSSSITLPHPGCWRISSRVGSHVFRFIVHALPGDLNPVR
jgi:hypothetical protein